MSISISQKGVNPPPTVGASPLYDPYTSAIMALTGITVGQVCYVFVLYSGTLTAPSGWTLQDGGAPTDGYAVMYRVMTSADAAGSSYTWTWTSPILGGIAWYVLNGASRSNFGGAHGKANYLAGAAKNTPSIATAAGDVTLAVMSQQSPVNIGSTGYENSSQFGARWNARVGAAESDIALGINFSPSNPEQATGATAVGVDTGGFAYILDIRPAQSPNPVTGITISPTPVDRSATISWNAITTDPDTPSSAMQYLVEYSTNNGSTYTSLGLTSPGQVSTVVDTSGWNITTTGIIRVTGYDGEAFGTPGTSSAFTIQHAPSTPTNVLPAGPTVIAIGSTYAITWTQSTDPNEPQANIEYQIDYSANNGTTWTNIVSLTSPGVGTYSWNTTGLSAGSQYLIRIRAWDPAESLWSGYGQSATAFSLATPVAPSAPTWINPTNGAVIDRSQSLIAQIQYNVSVANPQTEVTWAWGTDGSTFPNSNVVSGTSDTETYAGATFPHGTVYIEAKCKNAVGYGAFAQISFLAGNVPETPTITAPTSGSPPTTSRPTVTITESTAHTAYQYRIVKSGVEVFNSGIVTSSALSWTLGFDLANGQTYTLYVKKENSDGLWSLEASQTFTVVYTGPAVPTAVVTADDANGRIVIAITNPDNPDHNNVYRYGDTSSPTAASAIRININGVAPNGTFYDNTAQSGVMYFYWVRAVAATGLYTDSEVY